MTNASGSAESINRFHFIVTNEVLVLFSLVQIVWTENLHPQQASSKELKSRRRDGNSVPDSDAVYLSLMHGTAWMMPSFFTYTCEAHKKFSFSFWKWKCAKSEFVIDVKNWKTSQSWLFDETEQSIEQNIESVTGLCSFSSFYRSTRRCFLACYTQPGTMLYVTSSCSQFMSLSITRMPTFSPFHLILL